MTFEPLFVRIARVVDDHKRLLATRASPFEKNRLSIAIHQELDVTVWASDLATVQFHMRDKCCVYDNYRRKYLHTFDGSRLFAG